MKDRVSGLSGEFTVDFSKTERNDLRGTITSREGEEVPFCVVVANGDPSPAKCKRMNLHMECEGIDVFADSKEISPKGSQAETRKALQIPNALTDAVFGPQGYRDCAK